MLVFGDVIFLGFLDFSLPLDVSRHENARHPRFASKKPYQSQPNPTCSRPNKLGATGEQCQPHRDGLTMGDKPYEKLLLGPFQISVFDC